MVKSTLIFRNDGLPLSATVDDDQTQNLTEQKNQAKAIVNKVNSNSASEASIRSGSYTIHYLLRESIVFLVIVDKSFSRNLAFAYLQEIANEFINSHGAAALRTDTRPYQFVSFDSFMSKTKKLYQDSRTQSNLDHLNNELSDVKRIMTKNIEDLLYRGESLDDMSDLSYNLRNESKKYRKAARRINLEALIKQYVPVAMVGLLFVFIIWWMFLR